MQWLKISTAVSKIVGPILDSTGAEYASAVIGDLSLSKNGGTLTALASAATLTYIANGYYTLALTTGNTDTLGSAEISVNKSTYQMPPREFMVLPATVYDALVTNATTATGGLGDIQRMAGTTLTARDIGASVLLSNGTGTGQVKLASGYVAMTWADIAAPTTTVNLSGTTISAVSNAVGSVTGNVGGNVTGSVGSVLGDVGGDLIGSLPSYDNGAGALEAELLFVGASHAVVDAAGSTVTFPTVVGTSTLTQTQVTGGAYALNSSSFAFNSAMDFTTTQKAATLARVTLTDTVTTYTANTPQTGDSYARIGANGASLTALQSSIWSSAGATVNLSGTTVKAVTDRVTANTDQIEGTDATNVLDARITAMIHDNGLVLGVGTAGVATTGDSAIDLSGLGMSATPGGDGPLGAWLVAIDYSQARLITAYDVNTQLAGVDRGFDIATAPGDRIAVVTAAMIMAVDSSGAALPTVATIAAGVWQDTTAGHFTTAGSIGKSLAPATLGTAPGAATGLAIVGSAMAIGTDGLSAAAVSAAGAAKVADVMFRRTMAHVEASSDGDTLSLGSLYGLVQMIQKSNTTAHANKLTTYKIDGVSELGQKDLTTDPDAEPTTGIS